MQSTTDWRAALREASANPWRFRTVRRGDRRLFLEVLVREQVPRVVGYLATPRARTGTFHCPHCSTQHIAPMAREHATYARASCRGIPAESAPRFVIVQAWSSALDIAWQRARRSAQVACRTGGQRA